MYDKVYNIAHKMTYFISSKTKGKQSENNFLVKFLNEEYKKDSDIKVLDMGCDEGRITKMVKDKIGNLNITGVDINKSAIDLANEKFDNINFQYFDDDFIQKNKGQYDIIFSTHVLEHVPNAEEFIDLQIDLLKDNGKLVIIIPQERVRGDLQIIPIVLNAFRFVFKNPHVRKITKSELEEMMKRKGFELDKYIYTNFFGPHISNKKRFDSIGLSCYFEKS